MENPTTPKLITRIQSMYLRGRIFWPFFYGPFLN